jgi:single-strand DNA-binding protein
MSYHKVILVGFCGRDPELRFLPSGKAVTSFSVASNHKYQNSAGEMIDETTWFRVSVWGKQAEACKQYLAKGKQVLVEGRLACDKTTGGPRTYKRQDGEMATSFEINADTVRFLGQRGESSEPVPAALQSEEEIAF